MTVRMVREPSFVIQCDHFTDGVQCSTRYAGERAWSARQCRDEAVARARWKVRPAHGKGQRTAPDLCPVHKGES